MWFFWSSTANVELFWSEGVFPVNLQTNMKSKEDTSFEVEAIFIF